MSVQNPSTKPPPATPFGSPLPPTCPNGVQPPTRWAVIGPVSRTEIASRPSSSAWSPGVLGMWPEGSARGARRPGRRRLPCQQSGDVVVEQSGGLVGDATDARVILDGCGGAFGMGEVAAAHEQVTGLGGEPSGLLVGERRDAHLTTEVLTGPQVERRERSAVEHGSELPSAIEHQQILGNPDGGQLDD